MIVLEYKNKNKKQKFELMFLEHYYSVMVIMMIINSLFHILMNRAEEFRFLHLFFLSSFILFNRKSRLSLYLTDKNTDKEKMIS